MLLIYSVVHSNLYNKWLRMLLAASKPLLQLQNKTYTLCGVCLLCSHVTFSRGRCVAWISYYSPNKVMGKYRHLQTTHRISPAFGHPIWGEALLSSFWDRLRSPRQICHWFISVKRSMFVMNINCQGKGPKKFMGHLIQLFISRWPVSSRSTVDQWD